MIMKSLFVFIQASASVPLPLNKSKQISPSFDEFVISFSIKFNGFCYLCILPFFNVGVSTNS